ncbi:MAG: hypothetical protein ACFHVJ_02175 [Aestuariibacter sp.]
MDNPKLSAILNRLRTQYVETESDSLLCQNQLIQVDGCPYKLNVWCDFHGADKVVVFELKEPSVLSTERRSVGLKYSATDNSAEKLSQQQLSNIGIY